MISSLVIHKNLKVYPNAQELLKLEMLGSL
jgi:hypothetical protein